MQSLFGRILAAFLLTFALMFGAAALVLLSGYSRSLSVWSSERQASVRDAAEQVLQNYEAPPTESRDIGEGEQELPLPLGLDDRLVSLSVPVFVYDTDGRLIASNRGAGRRREADGVPRRAVHDEDGVLLGYYAGVTSQFHQDDANRALLASLLRALILGGLAALLVALVTAFLVSRTLARPARQVADGLDALSAGLEHGIETPYTIPEVGTREIACIARAANQLTARLSSERAIRTQWSQDLAHDLRSPVASIRAQLEAIVDGVFMADTQRIAGTLRELGRVERLIQDLEELMRLEAPELRLQLSNIRSDDFFNSLRERFDHGIRTKSIELQVEATIPSFTADESLLYRAVSNVLSNAVRHTPEQGVIRLSVSAETLSLNRSVSSSNTSTKPSAVVIEMSNTGDSIPSHDLAHIFDRLYRGEYARSSPGSGLGLTIARRIVELHGGDITVDTGANAGPGAGGTAFRIVIPVNT